MLVTYPQLYQLTIAHQLPSVSISRRSPQEGANGDQLKERVVSLRKKLQERLKNSEADAARRRRCRSLSLRVLRVAWTRGRVRSIFEGN